MSCAPQWKTTMASSTLDAVADGQRVFVDAPIFIYHFTGASEACRRFLRRCEEGGIDACTSTVVVAEVSHRLMLIEAVVTGAITAGNGVKKLRRRPDVVRGLTQYRAQIAQIPAMGVDVLPLAWEDLIRAGEVQEGQGLLTNDSLVVAAAIAAGVSGIASADHDFADIEGLTLYRPTDLEVE